MPATKNLKWTNQTQSILFEFANFWKQELFSDCTIICEGNHFPVHRLVLSSCSDYFKEVFDNGQCCHSTILVDDISAENLQVLLNYMYQGHSKVPVEKFSQVIMEGQALKIKGFENPTQLVSSFSSKNSAVIAPTIPSVILSDVASSEVLVDSRKHPIVLIEKLHNFDDICAKRRLPEVLNVQNKKTKSGNLSDNLEEGKPQDLSLNDQILSASPINASENVLNSSNIAENFDNLGVLDMQNTDNNEEKNMDVCNDIRLVSSENINALSLNISDWKNVEVFEKVIPDENSSSLKDLNEVGDGNTPLLEKPQNSTASTSQSGLDGEDTTLHSSVTGSSQKKRSNLVLPLKNESEGAKLKSRPFKRPLRPCIFCLSANEKIFEFVKLSQHLKGFHKNEEEVKKAVTLPQKSQRHVFDLIRKRGIKEINSRLYSKFGKDAELLRERRQNLIETKVCVGCNGFYSKKAIFAHVKRCKEIMKKGDILARKTQYLDLDCIFLPSSSHKFFQDIINPLWNDDAGNFIRSCEILKELGEVMHNLNNPGGNVVCKSRAENIRNFLRSLSSLFLEFREKMANALRIDPGSVTFEEMFQRQTRVLEGVPNVNVKILKSVIKEVSDGSKIFRMKLFLNLRKGIKILRGIYSRNCKAELANELVFFKRALGC